MRRRCKTSKTGSKPTIRTLYYNRRTKLRRKMQGVLQRMLRNRMKLSSPNNRPKLLKKRPRMQKNRPRMLKKKSNLPNSKPRSFDSNFALPRNALRLLRREKLLLSNRQILESDSVMTNRRFFLPLWLQFLLL